MKIDIFFYNKNMVYVATLGESQGVINWRLVLEEISPNIQGISVFYHILSEMLRSIITAISYQYNTSNRVCLFFPRNLFIKYLIEYQVFSLIYT